MTIGTISSDQLDDYVAEVDERGGLGTEATRELNADFEIELSVDVDQSADPFSAEYIASQEQVYRELSGREIDQDENEITPLDVDELVGRANPYGSTDATFIAKHARTILTSILVSQLPMSAKVLDMGCGWGLSTEMFGFTGCDVTAVDINPLFVDLVSQRAAARGYQVETVRSAFDEVTVDGLYDLVFFYESFHHAILPWKVLDVVGPLVKPGGKITLAGEPINDYWWKNWGLRLDADSVYCIRKFGWFENGWSADFITECFRRSGFELNLLPGIGLDQTTIGVATRIGDGVTGISSAPVLATEPDGVAAAEARLGAEVERFGAINEQLAAELARLHQTNGQLSDELGRVAGLHDILTNSRWNRLGRALRRVGDLGKR